MTVENNREVLQLQERIKNCKESIDEKEKILSRYHTRLADLLHNLNATNEQTGKVVTTRVSDHAVLRYLERHYKMDIGKIRSEIMTPVAEAAINAGAKSIKVNGISFVIKDNTIITSLTEKDIVKRRLVNSKKYLMTTEKKRKKEWR